MPFSQETVDGFLLAALLHGDNDPSSAPGLTDEGRAEIQSRHGALASLTTQARSAALASSVGMTGPLVAETELPRVRAMVSTFAPKDVGRRWLAEAPPMRRGFAPERALRDVVVRSVSAGTAAARRATQERSEVASSDANVASNGTNP